MLEFDWLLTPLAGDSLPRQRALYLRLREAVLSGRLPADTRLPASRRLAATLGIARNTVLFAYEQLVAEGCLVADCRGTRVARLPAREGREEREGMNARGGAATPDLSQRAVVATQHEPARDAEALPFSPGVPDFGAFPFHSWRACLERAWKDAGWRQLGYAAQGGDPALREALAAHLTSVRGLVVEAGQILITSGSQMALDLCARLLADHGDTVWAENPGYLAARVAFGLAGLRIHDVALDAEGLCATDQDWRQHPPRLILVTPSHQYPTGAVMSLARRLALIERAVRAGAWIVEDDYDSEFRRAGPAPPALFGLQSDAPVVYVGTFSKTLYPGLRLGYLVLPRGLAPDFIHAAAHATRAGQGVEQRALADFIQRGFYTSHLRRMRGLYSRRQALLRLALQEAFGPGAQLSGGEAGLHLVMTLPERIADGGVAERASRIGLGVRALSAYARPPVHCNGLVLGYGNLDEDNVAEAVRRLKAVVAGG